jgi:protoporphyrinogen IX oxidase
MERSEIRGHGQYFPYFAALHTGYNSLDWQHRPESSTIPSKITTQQGMPMLWFRAFHIIGVICWFAAIFYLPRLFVYHAMSDDTISIERFKTMERKLYYGIMWPSAVLTTIFGVILLSYSWQAYFSQAWMHAKLTLVAVLWAYHLMCGHYLKKFARDNNQRSHVYYRIFNEIPTVLLVAIVILVVVKPIF